MKEYEPIRFPENSPIRKLEIYGCTEPSIKVVDGMEADSATFVGIGEHRNGKPVLTFGFHFQTEPEGQLSNRLYLLPQHPAPVLAGVLGMHVLEGLNALDSSMLPDVYTGMNGFLSTVKKGSFYLDGLSRTSPLEPKNPVQLLAHGMASGLVEYIDGELTDHLAQQFVARNEQVDWEEFRRNFSLDYLAQNMPFVHAYAIAPYN